MSPSKKQGPGESSNSKADKGRPDEKNVFPDNQSSRATPPDTAGNDNDSEEDDKGVMSDINGPTDSSDN